MINAIHQLTALEFGIFLWAIFTTLIQLSLLMRLMLSRASASLIPGYLAIVLWFAFFLLTA